MVSVYSIPSVQVFIDSALTIYFSSVGIDNTFDENAFNALF